MTLSPKASATKRYFLLSAHHLAFSVALLAQAHQQQAWAVPDRPYFG